MIDVSAWPGLRLVEQVTGGNRNEVWRGELNGQAVAVRRTRRSPASLAWELDLIEFLGAHGFVVPPIVETAGGSRSADRIVVQQWIEGRPPATDADWQLVAAEIRRLHSVTAGYAQRPGCCTVLELDRHRRSVDADLDAMPKPERDVVLAVFAQFGHVATAVVHGDVGEANLRITAEGSVGLLDWDESRVDVIWHDLSPLPTTPILDPREHAASQRLSHAWEAANGWLTEPEYAQRRLAALAGTGH